MLGRTIMQSTLQEQKIIQILLQQGLINARQIQECLAVQQRYQQQGQVVPLSEVLLKRQYLTAEQLEKAKKSLPDSNSTTDTAQLPQAADTGEIFTGEGETPFGRYKIIKELGRGGMGVVYQAYDPNLKRHIALKIINHLMANDKQKKRFEREASMMAKLNHPNIIKIFDIGEEQGHHFFTMELLEGTGLSKLMEENMPLPQLLKILIKATEAVQYAHEQGIVHRDLKPANIIVEKDADPKVMDFGLAKEVEKADGLSQTQDLVGTPEYMSPEQAGGKGRGTDTRSDIYALGAILYQMLVGRPPFTGTNTINVLYQIAFQEPIPPSRIYPQVSRDIEAVCLKALEKNRDRRYQSAHEFAMELTRYLEGKPVLAKPLTQLDQVWKWVRRNRLLSSVSAGALVLVIGMVCGLLYQLEQKRQIAEEGKSRAEQLEKKAQQKAAEALQSKAEAEKDKIKAEQLAQIAQSKEAEAIMSRAEAELVLAKNFIERQNFLLADEKLKIADKLLIEANKKLTQAMPAASHPDMQTASGQKLLHWGQTLLTATRMITRYCIEPYRYRITTQDIHGKFAKKFFLAEVIQPSWRFLLLVTSSHDKAVIWDRESDREIKSFSFSPLPNASTFSTNDRLLAMGDKYGNVVVWEIGTEKLHQLRIKSDEADLARIRMLRFSSDDKWLVAMSEEKTVMWDVDTMATVLERTYANQSPVCAFSKNSKWLVVGGKHGVEKLAIQLYDLSTIKPGSPPAERKIWNTVEALCFGPDDKSLLIGEINDIKVYPLETTGPSKESMTLFGAHRGHIMDIALSADENLFASLGKDRKVAVWSTYNYRKIFETEGTGDLSDYGYIRFHPQQKQFTVWNETHITTYDWECNQVRHLDMLRRKEMRKDDINLLKLRRVPSMRNQAKMLLSLAFSPTKEYLAYYVFPSLYLWDIPKDHIGYLMTHILSESRHLSFSSDSKLLFWHSYSKAFLWDVQTREKIFTYDTKPKEALDNWALQPHTNLLVMDGEQSTKFCRIQDHRLVCQREIKALPTGTTPKIFDASGHKAALVYGGNQIAVWSVDTPEGKLLSFGQVKSQSEIRYAVCFAEDSYLALGNKNGDFLLYDWQRNQLVHTISLYDPIDYIWYHAAEKLYFIRTTNGLYIYPHIEDADYRERMDRIYPLPFYAGYPILAVTISQDFRYLALGLQTGEVIVFSLQPG